MKNEKFRKLSDRKTVVDLIPYIKNYFDENPTHSLYIGSDSQNIGNFSVYGIVIVFHKNNKGGHVLYTKRSIPRIHERDKYTRLLKEAEYSIELADYLVANGIQKPTFIDLDLNPDPKYASNQVLRAAVGWVEGMGYKVRIKPNSLVASYVADLVCKQK